MTRTAIVSDIHGNLAALEAVLEDISKQKVDRIVCLGSRRVPGVACAGSGGVCPDGATNVGRGCWLLAIQFRCLLATSFLSQHY